MAAAGRLSILDRFLTLWPIYCWTRITYEAATDERKGQVFMLGVDPDYRTFVMTFLRMTMGRASSLPRHWKDSGKEALPII